MNVTDIVLLVIIGAVFLVSLRKVLRNLKAGKCSCCSDNCGSCGGSCPKNHG